MPPDTCPAGAAIALDPVPAPAPEARRHAWALAILLIGAFLPPLDYFIVNLALPSIRSSLHTSSAELQLIVSSYASAYAVFLITGGRLGDLLGRKRMFLTGMAGFILASALCGLSQSADLLIAGRVLQGLAASVMAPQVLATLRTLFSTAEQPRVMSLYGSVFGLAAVVGQLGGGALITWHPFGIGWQSIFWVNVPIGSVAFCGAFKLIPETPRRADVRIDLIGVLLLSLCLGLLIYPLTRGREEGWPAWTVVSLLASMPVLALFIMAEKRIARRGGDPLVHMELFDNRAFVIGLTMTFLFYFLSAFFLTYGIFLQNGIGMSPLQSGLAVMPYAIGFLIGPFGTPPVARHIGHHILTLGFSLIAFGFCIVIATLYWGQALSLMFFAGLACAGIGQGFILPSLVRIVLSEVSVERAGIASGLVTSLLQIGSAVGVAVVAGVFYSVLGTQTDRAAYNHAFAVTLEIVVVLMVICLTLGNRLASRHGKRHG
jgi:EmrB/QacA subfamily drug resistance transporter